MNEMKTEDDLDRETNPVSTLGDIKQEVPSVPLQRPDVKVEVSVSYVSYFMFILGLYKVAKFYISKYGHLIFLEGMT
jgi:hypothetical protein